MIIIMSGQDMMKAINFYFFYVFLYKKRFYKENESFLKNFTNCSCDEEQNYDVPIK